MMIKITTLPGTEGSPQPHTVPCESIHPLGIFPFLLPYNLESIFGEVVSFDLYNMPTTLKMQNIFYCETDKK